MAEKINNEKVATVPENSNEKNSKKKRLFDGFPFKSPMECYRSYCEIDSEAFSKQIDLDDPASFEGVSLINSVSFMSICKHYGCSDYDKDMFYSDNGRDFQDNIFRYDPYGGVDESVFNDVTIASDSLVVKNYKFFYDFLHKIYPKSDIGFTIMFDETYRFGNKRDIFFDDDRVQRFLLFKAYSLSDQKNSFDFDYVLVFCKHGSDIPIAIPCKIYENGSFELTHPVTIFKRDYEVGAYVDVTNEDLLKITTYIKCCEESIMFKYREYRVYPGTSNDDEGHMYFSFMSWQEQCWFNARFVENILNLDWYWRGYLEISSDLRRYICSDDDDPDIPC